MRRLSLDLERLEAHYDAVVVGSGYGAGVAASRLARMGLKIAVLERGREFAAGDFPDTLAEAEAEFQYTSAQGHEGRPTALFDMRLGRDMHTVVGCGLGGTSLINANVGLAADPRVWEDAVWPREILEDALLEEGYTRARRMLRPTPFPAGRSLDKLARLAEAGKALGREVTRPPLYVSFSHETNAAGVDQPACTSCGDCCAGCNVGAKSTVDITYIADAVNHGANVFTEIAVRALTKEADGNWRVFFESTGGRASLFASPTPSLTAGIVVLGAGSLGSTEILMRSRDLGLAVSDRLGQGFTSNGDVLGFSYDNQLPVNAIGIGTQTHAHVAPPGPCITGAIDLRDTAHLADGLMLQEGVIPSALQKLLPALFAAGAAAFGERPHDSIGATVKSALSANEGALLGSYRGAMHNTQMYLVMSHDGQAGPLALQKDRGGIVWPEAARADFNTRAEAALRKAATTLGGTYLSNPTALTAFGKTIVTAHPLGGCGIGADRVRGVIDHKGLVFDASPGNAPAAVHRGLYVCCGAAIPRSLGVNPSLTITALAERAMSLLARDLGKPLTDARRADAPRRDAAASLLAGTPAGVTFTERMAGEIAVGAALRLPFAITATIQVADIARFVADPQHTGSIVGTVSSSALSPLPLDISDGVFNLLTADPDNPRTRRFEYVMRLNARDGRTYAFHGQKIVHIDHAGADLFADTTTLYIRAVELSGNSAVSAPYEGVLTIAAADFLRQLRTIRGVGGRTPTERVEAVAAFARLFAGALGDVYATSIMPLSYGETGRARKRRDLVAPIPELHHFATDDHKLLLLTRYNGGAKGPLLFAHGLGVSSGIFTTDTIATNLLEYMAAAGYDCWLLDYRASTDLAYAREPQTADDVAIKDYPAAVKYVLEATGRPSLQVLAHCFGAMSDGGCGGFLLGTLL